MTVPTARLDAGQLQELEPFIRRTATLDPGALVRVRPRAGSIAALVRLPFGVLAGRTVSVPDGYAADDAVFAAQALLEWIERGGASPMRLDAGWRVGVPPESGWSRLEVVPDSVVRDLVRAGATALKEAAEREGVPNAQPRAEVTDALLDSVVLTVENGPARVELRLRQLSALVRMGFLRRGSEAAVDIGGRWVRVAAAYGSVFSERPGLGLGLLPAAR